MYMEILWTIFIVLSVITLVLWCVLGGDKEE